MQRGWSHLLCCLCLVMTLHPTAEAGTGKRSARRAKAMRQIAKKRHTRAKRRRSARRKVRSNRARRRRHIRRRQLRRRNIRRRRRARVGRPSWRQMWQRKRQKQARHRTRRRRRKGRRKGHLGRHKRRRVARLFRTSYTPRALLLKRRLVAQAKALQVKLPENLPPRSDASYPSMPLSNIYKLAKRNNLDLRILQQRIIQAELARAKSWSILKPQLSISATYVRSDSAVELGGTLVTPQNQLAFQTQLQWGLINFSAIPILRTAYLAVKQVGQTAKQVKREILYGAARAYYGVLLADGLLTIAKQTWSNAKERLRISRARLKAGVTPELDVTRAQLDVAKAWQSWIQAENGLRNARLGLALLLNKPHLNIRAVRPSSPQLVAASLASLRQKALANRKEVKVAKLAVKIAQEGVTQQWTAYLPTIAAVGQAQGSNAGGLNNRNYQWSVTVVARMNLYSGGTRYLQVKEAYSKLLQARLELAKAIRQADNEVSQALISVKNAKVTVQVAKKQRMLAERTYQLTQDRYKTGVATPVEVSDALTALQSARIAVLREELNYELAVLALRRATGDFRP